MIGSARACLAKVFQGLGVLGWELAIMRILVTGASGQLGSYLAAELLHAKTSQIVLWSRARHG